MRCGGRGAARGVARRRRPRTGAAGARARGDDAAAHLAQLLRELDHEGGALLRRERGDVDGWCDVRLNENRAHQSALSPEPTKLGAIREQKMDG